MTDAERPLQALGPAAFGVPYMAFYKIAAVGADLSGLYVIPPPQASPQVAS